jgi:CMP-N,N'-diacetyllegionaminic acid synthase
MQIPKILCIIPARSGSKGIKNKNIKLFNDKPLLIWTIEQALNCKYEMKIIVSTDSIEYKRICDEYYSGLVPFLRPVEISEDLSTDFEFLNHATEWLNTNESYICDIILHLRPTSPLRKVSDINKALDIFIENRDKYDSLRSVIEVGKTPFKMYTIENDNLKPLFSNLKGIKEPFNRCRQELPKTYLHNGYIDILNYSVLSKKDGTISGENILPYLMNEEDNIDIDTYNDWKKINI